ncbi:MAG TPA: hypothetical protein VNN81_15095 [Bradyrhizobium sp.]|nr:hypothetical protein [Bradyrhizobium sp.]
MNDRVDGERQTGSADYGGRFALRPLHAGKPGDPVAGTCLEILQAELDVLDPCFDQVAHPIGVELMPDVTRLT